MNIFGKPLPGGAAAVVLHNAMGDPTTSSTVKLTFADLHWPTLDPTRNVTRAATSFKVRPHLPLLRPFTRYMVCCSVALDTGGFGTKERKDSTVSLYNGYPPELELDLSLCLPLSVSVSASL